MRSVKNKIIMTLVLTLLGAVVSRTGLSATELDALEEAGFEVEGEETFEIEIVDNQGNRAVEETQLSADEYNVDANNQLLLDCSYYVRWNDSMSTDSESESVSGNQIITEDESVDIKINDKYLRFPFDVVYDNTIYYADEVTGYTDWILVTKPEDNLIQWDTDINPDEYNSANHWQMTPFYIPCFSQEGGCPGKNMYVEAKVVESSTAPGEENFASGDKFSEENNLSEDQDKEPEIDSPDSETEITEKTARIQIQLSGWMYGLTITGTDNSMVYNGSGLLNKRKLGKDTYSMATVKLEIRSGTNNRLGTNTQRFLLDGSMAGSSPEELTLPLRNGSSLSFPSMGAVWKGQEVAFIIKTMANLSGNNDSIEIVPDILFQTPDGETLSYRDGEIKIYITDAVGNWMGKEYDPADWDISDGTAIALGDTLFNDCYYDSNDVNDGQFGNWPQETLQRENLYRETQGLDLLTMRQLLERNTPSYTMSHISVSSSLRLYSGEYEQLAMNANNMYDRETNTSTLKNYQEWNNYNVTTSEKVIDSMQQWHFKYSVPNYIKVVDVRGKGGTDFEIQEYVSGQERWWWESDPDVYTDKGFLLIQFQISAYKDGKPYLHFAADGGLNMWEREGYNLNYPQGTVMIVDMSKSMSDYYQPAVQNVN